jgi:hypothetical protein
VESRTAAQGTKLYHLGSWLRLTQALARSTAAASLAALFRRNRFLTAAVVGVMLARRSRTLEVLADADADNVAAVLA